ncbi:MAG: phage tail family protein [Clostridia bacterium]
MIGAFKFNDIDSSSFELICKSVKRPLLPAKKNKRVNIASVSGVYDFPDNEYDIRYINMSITYLGKSFDELRSRAREIANWLSASDWCKLIINDESDKYYLAKVVDEIDLDTMLEAGIAEISFECQPFAYSVENSIHMVNIQGEEGELNFTNNGTRVINYLCPIGSMSKVYVEGSWDSINIAINDKNIDYNYSSSGLLMIDNIEMEIMLNSESIFKDVSGDIDSFFHINSGDNYMMVTGSNLNVKVSIEYIPMWL